MSNEEKITAEGPTLAEALAIAATELGVTAEDLDYQYDRDHLASGASSVRIFELPATCMSTGLRCNDTLFAAAMRRRAPPLPRRTGCHPHQRLPAVR